MRRMDVAILIGKMQPVVGSTVLSAQLFTDEKKIHLE